MKLFDSEWKVMEVLWQENDRTAKEISLRLADSIGWSKIRLPSSCSMPLCKGSKPAQYSIREIFFIRLVSSCAVLFASKVVEKL